MFQVLPSDNCRYRWCWKELKKCVAREKTNRTSETSTSTVCRVFISATVCVHVKGHKLCCHKSVSAFRLVSTDLMLLNSTSEACWFIYAPRFSLMRCKDQPRPAIQQKNNYRNRAAAGLNWRCASELELPLWKPPYLSCTTLLFWCSRSCLLSGRWQRAKEVIASLELAPCENTATAGAIDWRTAHSVAADAARVPLLPSLRPCRTFCSKRLRGIQLTKTLLSC